MLQAILAISNDGVIGVTGKDGPTLPWRLPPDLKRFRWMTTGHAIIMGRTTWDSIGKPLPERRNIVISRRWNERPPPNGIYPVDSPERALEVARQLGDREPFVVGGAEIYAALWDRVQVVHLTTVDVTVGRGVTFRWDPMQWSEGGVEEGEYEGLRYRFTTLARRPATTTARSDGAK